MDGMSRQSLIAINREMRLRRRLLAEAEASEAQATSHWSEAKATLG
jgi:hypothetical protein